MKQLVAIEWRRMWSRRMSWMVMLLVGSAMVVSGVANFATSSAEPPDTSEIDEVLANDIAQCRLYSVDEWNRFDEGALVDADPGYLEYLGSFPTAEAYADEACNPMNFGYAFEDGRFCVVSLYEPTVQYRQGCPDLDAAQVSEYIERTIMVNDVEYRSARPMANGIIPVMSLMLFALAAVIGASFIGAEYAAATIETTLLWEPRRKRVLTAKLVVAAITAFLIHVFLLSVLTVSLLPAALWRGSTAGGDSEFWFGLVGGILRGGVAAAAVALIALSISTITRATVGGVVALIGYIAISPSIAYTLLKGYRPFDLTENLTAFANGGEVGRFITNDEGYLETVFSHSGTVALAVIAVYAILAMAAATAVFSRRDID